MAESPVSFILIFLFTPFFLLLPSTSTFYTFDIYAVSRFFGRKILFWLRLLSPLRFSFCFFFLFKFAVWRFYNVILQAFMYNGILCLLGFSLLYFNYLEKWKGLARGKAIKVFKKDPTGMGSFHRNAVLVRVVIFSWVYNFFCLNPSFFFFSFFKIPFLSFDIWSRLKQNWSW